MINTVKIIEHLSQKYLGKSPRRYEKCFGRIEYIKSLRQFAQQAQKDFDINSGTFEKLKYAKDFTDKVFENK